MANKKRKSVFSNENDRPNKTFIEPADPDPHYRYAIAKEVICINQPVTTNTPTSTTLFTVTFPCQLKSFIWDFSILGGNMSEDIPLFFNWWLHRHRENEAADFSTTNGATHYRPEENLIACGAHIFKPGLYVDTMTQDPSNPWIFDVDTDTDDPARVTGTSGAGVLASAPPAAITYSDTGTISGATLSTDGTIALQPDATISIAHQKFDIVYDKGQSGTFKKCMPGDSLKLTFKQDHATTGVTVVYGSVQFFVLS